MKKALLASTALVGAALLSAPAQAGTVGSGDNLAVSLSGFMWFQTTWLDEDNSTGHGRGLRMKIPETELHIKAKNTADNGLTYGVTIEMEVNTDAGNNADEVFAFVDGDFGRVEMGDQDDATNRMLVGAYQAHQGVSGPFGGLGGLAPVFHNQHPGSLSRTDWQALTSGDATKLTYFSPRMSGFQLGVSYTPDDGQNGASFGETDNDGDFENMFGLGVNFTDTIGGVGVSVSGLWETADAEPAGGLAPGGAQIEDLSIWGVGVKLDYMGFIFGANYRDNGDFQGGVNVAGSLSTAQTTAGQDGGDYYAVGLGYNAGPWGVSGWYSLGERDWGMNGTPVGVEESVERFGVGGRYAIAPGWQIRADYNFVEHNSIGGTSGAVTTGANNDNDSQAFILTNMINF